MNSRRLGQWRRTLLLMANLSCGLLARASMDLGDRLAAAPNERASRLGWPGKQAAHTLLAWIAGTPSLIACCRHQHQQHHRVCHTKSMQLEEVSGSRRVRLAALQARALCLTRAKSPATQAALDFATAAREVTTADELDSMGGVLDCPLAKQHAYAAE